MCCFFFIKSVKKKIVFQVKSPQKSRDPWETPKSTLKSIRRIGQGQFGEYWQGIWNKPHSVAIKKVIPGIVYI
jgi:hypothetical protein